MSLLTVLRDTPAEEKVPTRWVTVWEEEPSIEAPKLEVEIAYLDPDDWERMCRQYKRGIQFGLGWVQLLQSKDRERLLTGFLKKTLKGIKGLGRKNLPRISAQFASKPAALEQVPDTIEFSDELVEELAVLINHDTFIILHTAATDLNEFGVAIQSKNG